MGSGAPVPYSIRDGQNNPVLAGYESDSFTFVMEANETYTLEVLSARAATDHLFTFTMLDQCLSWSPLSDPTLTISGDTYSVPQKYYTVTSDETVSVYLRADVDSSGSGAPVPYSIRDKEGNPVLAGYESDSYTFVMEANMIYVIEVLSARAATDHLFTFTMLDQCLSWSPLSDPPLVISGDTYSVPQKNYTVTSDETVTVYLQADVDSSGSGAPVPYSIRDKEGNPVLAGYESDSYTFVMEANMIYVIEVRSAKAATDHLFTFSV